VVGEVLAPGRSDELCQCDPVAQVPPGGPASNGTRPDYAWTDLTYLLHKHHVSWRYYVFKGGEPDCEDDGAMFCNAKKQNAKTPGSGTRCRASRTFATTISCGTSSP
jgi:hypothetical protein